MASLVIPVLLSFFLGPGIGQLYNKDYKKGVILILSSLAILIVAGVWYFRQLQPFLPADLAANDPQAVQQLMTNAAGQISATQGKILAAFQALLVVIWIYGVVDAYRVADQKRRNVPS